jgi:hypothetical protein
MEREYYAQRKGFIKIGEEENFDLLVKGFHYEFQKMFNEGYFQKYFGYDCTDGFVSGLHGTDINTFILLKTGKTNLLPVSDLLKIIQSQIYIQWLNFYMTFVLNR